MADAGALGGHSVSSVSGLGSHQAAHPVQGHKPGTEEGWVICQDLMPYSQFGSWNLPLWVHLQGCEVQEVN